MTEQTPMAFMSYAHSDDEYQHITTFCKYLSREVQAQHGKEFPIFLDRKDIRWGQSWKQRIDNSIDEVTFLIPIISPSFFNSEYCRKELARFVEREKRLDRNDLVLPVYFIDADVVNDKELRADDPLAEVIASRQYADWRDLRFETFTNPVVMRRLADIVKDLRRALPRVQPAKKVVQPIESAPAKKAPVKKAKEKTPEPIAQPTTDTSEKGEEQPTTGPTAKKDPPTYIVDPMHRGNFDTIADAIKRVGPGSRILVRPGLYQESLVVDKPLEIIGDGAPGEVVIRTTDTSVIRFQATMGRVVNLTLRQLGGEKAYCVDIAQGRLELDDCDISCKSSSCVAIRGSADPRLRRNKIHGSKESGGVLIYENAQGTLEDNDIFDNTLSGVEIKQKADPTIRRNRIRDSRQGGGIFVYENGLGTIEDNEIFGVPLSGIVIETAANPTFRRNRIHHCQQAGAYIFDEGQGTLEDNDIFSNGSVGVICRTGANPVVRNNRINKNEVWGVWVYDNGGGTFEGNDLRENVQGPWLIDEKSEAKVTRSNNKDK